MGGGLAQRPRVGGRPAKAGSKGLLRVKWTLSGYVLRNDDGSGKVAGPFETRSEAEAARDLLKAASHPRKTWRPCLSCARDFPSEGIHNRLCEACRDHGLPNQYVGG